MEAEDFLRFKDAELAAEREDNTRLRARCAALEKESDLLIASNLQLKREVRDLRKQVQSWADEADADIQLAALRRAEMEACDL
jgi:cell division protein FtsB